MATISSHFRLLEKIHSASGNERKKTILNRFITQWREAHDKLHQSDAAGTTVSVKPFTN